MKKLFKGLERLVLLLFVSMLGCNEISLNSDASDIPYDDCGGSDSQQVAKVTLTGCDTDDICQIVSGSSLRLTVNWITFQDEINTLKSALKLSLFNGFSINISAKPSDACDYLKCPIKKSSQVAYSGNFTVPNIFLPGSGRILWQGYDKSENDPLLCISFRVNIQTS